MVELTYTPDVLNSRFIAANNPVPFILTRKDAIIISIQPYTGSGSGDVEVVTLLDMSSEINIGDSIYLKSEDISGYDGQYIVEYIDAYTIICSGRTSGQSSSLGYINFIDAREDYYIQLDLLVENNSVISTYLNYHPSLSGIINLDFSILLKSFLSNNNTFAYDVVNAIQIGFAVEFNFIYREYWKSNGYTSWSSQLANNYIAVNAGMQIGDDTGQNMSPYVIFPNLQYVTPLELLIDMGGTYISDDDDALVQVNESNTVGKFLTMFEKPVYFNGYPFSLSFIYDASLSGFTNYVTKGEKQLNINGISIINTKTRLNEFGNDVNIMQLEELLLSSASKLKVFICNSDELIFNEYNDYRLNEVSYNNVGTSVLYNYNNILKKTQYVFNRFTGAIYNVIADNVEDVSPISYDHYIKIYDEAGAEVANYLVATSESSLLDLLWVVPDPTGEDFIGSSSDYGDLDIGFSSATEYLTLGMAVTPQDSVLNTIDSDGLSVNYHIGVAVNTIGAFSLPAFANYSLDLSGVTTEKLLQCFSHVKYDGVSDYTTYIYIVGKNGTLLRGAKKETGFSFTNVENCIDEIAAISHGLTTENLKRVWFINEDEGYAFGDNFTILKTIDAGLTWTKINVVTPTGYSTTCYDAMVVKNTTEEIYYFKCLNNSTNEYDILEFTGIGQFDANEICSEEKEIIINRECKDNAIYLRWLNPIGGFDYWLFERNQNISENVTDEISFNKVIHDMTNVRTRKEIISKKSSEEIELGADNLSIDQINGLKYILSSVKIEMYLGSENKWIEVNVPTQNFSIYETIENKASMLFTIVKPEKYLYR